MECEEVLAHGQHRTKARDRERDADGEEEKSRVHIQGLMHVNVEVVRCTVQLDVCIPPSVATAVKSGSNLLIKDF